MASISSRTFSEGGGVGRRELCLRTGEQQHQAYYRRGGVLIIDNFADSPRAAAIICFASVTTLQDRPPASMSIHYHSTRSHARLDEHSQLGVLCLSYGAVSTLSLAPIAIPCSRSPRLSFLSPTTPCSSLERRKAPALGLVSPSSRISAQALRIYTFATWCIIEVVIIVRCRQHPCTAAGCAREIVIPPHSSSAVAKVRISSWSPPTSVESHQSDTIGRRRDGQGSDASSYHALHALAKRSHEYHFSV